MTSLLYITAYKGRSILSVFLNGRATIIGSTSFGVVGSGDRKTRSSGPRIILKMDGTCFTLLYMISHRGGKMHTTSMNAERGIFIRKQLPNLEDCISTLFLFQQMNKGG